jgi:hypothetical protein
MGELHVNMNTTLDGVIQANGVLLRYRCLEGLPETGNVAEAVNAVDQVLPGQVVDDSPATG